MKLYLEPVSVDAAVTGEPTRLIWRRELYKVIAIQERWLYNGKWWTTPKLRGRFRKYYRLTVKPISMMAQDALEVEIYQESGQWMLSRLCD